MAKSVLGCEEMTDSSEAISPEKVSAPLFEVETPTGNSSGSFRRKVPGANTLQASPSLAMQSQEECFEPVDLPSDGEADSDMNTSEKEEEEEDQDVRNLSRLHKRMHRKPVGCPRHRPMDQCDESLKRGGAGDGQINYGCPNMDEEQLLTSHGSTRGGYTQGRAMRLDQTPIDRAKYKRPTDRSRLSSQSGRLSSNNQSMELPRSPQQASHSQSSRPMSDYIDQPLGQDMMQPQEEMPAHGYDPGDIFLSEPRVGGEVRSPITNERRGPSSCRRSRYKTA